MEEFLIEKLRLRQEIGLKRKLMPQHMGVDFSSNDYLGFANSETLHQRYLEALVKTDNSFGSTGSRLLTGNSLFVEELESTLSKFHQMDSGLLFNSGYQANIGLFSCVADRGDTYIIDERVHASIHDGVRLSYAGCFKFRHNDLKDLEKKIKKGSGTIFVVVESLYSMDGDLAPLHEIQRITRLYGAHLIVDEAHANGIYGDNGEGRLVELGLQNKVFASIITFGKALGCHGAIVLGSEHLKEYLVNFARPFIYTTALTNHSLVAIKSAYDHLANSKEQRDKLKQQIQYFINERQKATYLSWLDSESAIQGIVIPGNNEVKKMSNSIQKLGFDVRPILSPTIRQGEERIRICIHAFNTDRQIDDLFSALKETNI